MSRQLPCQRLFRINNLPQSGWIPLILFVWSQGFVVAPLAAQDAPTSTTVNTSAPDITGITAAPAESLSDSVDLTPAAGAERQLSSPESPPETSEVATAALPAASPGISPAQSLLEKAAWLHQPLEELAPPPHAVNNALHSENGEFTAADTVASEVSAIWTTSEDVEWTESGATSIQPLGNWKIGDPERSYRPYETMLASDTAKKKPWYEKLSIRGYAQLRYNRLLETNPLLVNPQGDRSIGNDNSFYMRRARLVVSGDVSERVYVYIQSDFASTATGSSPLHFLQMRDFYADIFLDEAKEFRIRAGQSKVPYGFENLQSSQNRIPLDRSDALNSGVVNERDLGLFFYWAPAEIRERFRELIQSGLKGSGDYGVLGLGVYNGQTSNQPERNDRVHTVFRITYPFKFESGQYFEPGFSWYTGQYVMTKNNGVQGPDEFNDERAAWSFMLYPQPFGLAGEYTIGIGPELNEARTFVDTKSLDGGYLQVFYRHVHDRYGVIIPFARVNSYRGGRKHETNSPAQNIKELEFGVEWEPLRELEITTNYAIGNRTSNVFPYVQESGSLMRVQLQWNY